MAPKVNPATHRCRHGIIVCPCPTRRCRSKELLRSAGTTRIKRSGRTNCRRLKCFTSCDSLSVSERGITCFGAGRGVLRFWLAPRGVGLGVRLIQEECILREEHDSRRTCPASPAWRTPGDAASRRVETRCEAHRHGPSLVLHVIKGVHDRCAWRRGLVHVRCEE